MRENRWAQERFGSYRSAHCQVYPEQGGRLKPDDVYYWGKSCPYQQPLAEPEEP